MYRLAESLDPERIYEVSRVAYDELVRAGVRTVGEFHYVHHQADGTPYDDRVVLAEAVIRAARDVGLRISLLRVIYARGGAGGVPEGAQRRFSDAALDSALGDVDTLRSRYRDAADVKVGVAPHSVRAVPPEWYPEIASYAAEHDLPVHMHLCEQPAEIEACRKETGLTPVALCAERGLLGARFVAVHATHLAPGEAQLLGDAGASACICPTTERDLGDGLPDVGALRDAGVRLCVGIDSHVVTAPLEDVRGVELGERLRTLRRVTGRPSHGTPAEQLWRIGSTNGALACGFDDAGGPIVVPRSHPSLRLVEDSDLLDAIVFSAGTDLFADSPRPRVASVSGR